VFDNPSGGPKSVPKIENIEPRAMAPAGRSVGMKLAAFTTPPTLIEGLFCAAEWETQIPPARTAAASQSTLRSNLNFKIRAEDLMRSGILFGAYAVRDARKIMRDLEKPCAPGDRADARVRPYTIIRETRWVGVRLVPKRTFDAILG
jgi:hypothetical protein